MNRCITCKIEKELTEFHKRRISKKGIQLYNSVCKECRKIYANNRYKNNHLGYSDRQKKYNKINKYNYKTEFLNYIKNHKCKDCGNNDYRVLEFDHLYGKEYNISDKIGSSKLEYLMKEINKCEIVCANCHRIRTYYRCNSYRK